MFDDRNATRSLLELHYLLRSVYPSTYSYRHVLSEQHQEIPCCSHVWEPDRWSTRLPCNRNKDRLSVLLQSLSEAARSSLVIPPIVSRYCPPNSEFYVFCCFLGPRGIETGHFFIAWHWRKSVSLPLSR